MISGLASFFRIVISIIMAITMPFNCILGKQTKKISRAKEDCRLSFADVSDTHVDEKGTFISQSMLEMFLMDLENADDKLDAAVINGDITNHGYIAQWDLVAESFKKYDAADNIYLGIGNHDTWGPNRDEFDNPVDGVRPTFIKYNKEITGRDIDNVYYSDVINGYYFIFLGSEEDHTSAYISDEQLEWFAGEMEKAAETGLPIFVFLHQSINGTHGLPYNWEVKEEEEADKGGIGDQSDAVVNILKKYDNVFYMSGHIHAGFKTEDDKIGVPYSSVEYIENDNGNKITLINTPSLTTPDVLRQSYTVSGCGYVFEVYDDEVIIRARNFSSGTWITKYDVTVELV